jgi:hypothetical protein
MGWDRPSHEESALRAAFAETTQAVGGAFAQATGRFGCPLRGPRLGTNPDDTVSRWVEWWLDIPSPFEAVSCELNLLVSSDGPEVFGRIAVWRYIGRGFSDNDDLWRSGDILVESPAAAAAALRQVGAELVRQCGLLDLRPYLASKTSEPGSVLSSGDS